MEAPLNAREFLKRFHLPQLVRLTGVDDEELEEDTKMSSSATSSRSLVALAQDERSKKAQHEKSNWTYRAAASRSQQELAEDSGFRSLLIDGHHEHLYDERQFRSMRGSSSNQQQQLAASQSQIELELERDEAKEAKRFEEEKPDEKLRDERHKLGIRLTPPSKQTATTKLKLNQPFLLYKAYKKLELCAYVIDLKNELNEKSGDPIYFPQNYPGWFSISSDHRAGRQSQQKGLDSIDDVCRTNAQIFLTRDELVGYQLPTKLSHLTKLKNNQLLALPLAINLDKISQEWGNVSGGGGAGSNNNKSRESAKEEQTNSISDIKQVVIECGQALKICGVYEDVLPLIERKQQQHNEFSKRNSDAPNSHCYAHSIQHYEMARQSSASIYHQMAANCPQLYQQQLGSAANKLQDHRMQNDRGRKADRSEKLAKLRYGGEEVKPQRAAAPVGQYAMGQLIYGQTQVMAAKAKAKGKKLKAGQQHLFAANGSKVSGQRYARCILLSQSSLDKLTNCAGGQAGAQDGEEEAEVLIPIDQRGRFYLCATNQSIADELYCRGCARSAHLVFRASQLMSLLSLSRRLASANEQNMVHLLAGARERPAMSSASIKLPLMVELVIGPRPSNFSPSMFGSSSSLDSYFVSETNVGGHSIGCRYNRNAASAIQSPPGGQVEACECAQRLMKPRRGSSHTYRLFSAALRIERLAKRDVLLACTIKRDPLIHLDLFSERILCPDSSQRQSQSQNQRNQKFNRPPDKPADELSGSCCIGQSTRLAALCENNSKQDKKANELKALGKSSFSRLKVCRSLISLNGRRKRRPNIPSSMLSANSLSFDDSALGGAPSGNQSIACKDAGICSSLADESFIILLEFDCNDTELTFVRTFVESSIPTSTIPDLVLNRMEFCHKNSRDWERQLKLSYLSLSRDFDLCKRQTELNRRRNQDRASRLLEQNTNELQMASSKFSPSAMQINKQAALGKPQLFHEKFSLMISTDNSTASSRSSSGVSSAGERRGADCKTAGSSLSGSKLQFSEPASSEGVSSGSGSLVAGGQSRLLRLVHRILPPFSRQTAAKLAMGGSGKRADMRAAQRLEDMSELSGRLGRELVVDCGDNQLDSQRFAADMATLMNAQKIHKKLTKLKGNSGQTSERHLSDNEEEEIGKASQLDHLADSGSHLYESLERLNESLAPNKQATRASHAHSPGSRSTCARADKHETLVIKRRRQLGKSMDFVGGGRRTALQLAGRAQDEESQDEDEWWQSSTRESTSFHGPQSFDRRPLGVRPARPNLDARNMEPVSIEACHFEHFEASEECDSLRSYQSSGAGCRSMEEAAAGSAGCEERIYMNLIASGFQSSASLPLAAARASEGALGGEQRPRRPVGRMERKLMKLRARRHAYPEPAGGPSSAQRRSLNLSAELAPQGAPGEWARRARAAYEAGSSGSSLSSSASQVNRASPESQCSSSCSRRSCSKELAELGNLNGSNEEDVCSSSWSSSLCLGANSGRRQLKQEHDWADELSCLQSRSQIPFKAAANCAVGQVTVAAQKERLSLSLSMSMEGNANVWKLATLDKHRANKS